jgi:L-ascorbate metabolism protein UlaG (beta-lactamase superfamily)
MRVKEKNKVILLHNKKWLTLGVFIFCFALLVFLLQAAQEQGPDRSVEKTRQISDHFDGSVFFNPGFPQPSTTSPGNTSNRGIFWYAWRWLFNNDRPEWPEIKSFSTGPPPTPRVPMGALRITTVGHSTFLIQMDEFNILTDPIWSNRCSPVSWAGPKRRQQPGIRFEDLPPVDVVLISHNHYDHLDLRTLKRLADQGTPQAVVPLGNFDKVREAGILTVDELDWWQSVTLSPNMKITFVPAQHFSARTPWDRDKTLWGGFVVSGPSGNIFYSGDTGYGPQFQEIARRFSPIRVAILPLSPFRPQQSKASMPPHFSVVHMGPWEAVRAHIDLNAGLSLAAHFQVFQLGWDGFDDAVNELASALKERGLNPDAFIAPTPGQVIEPTKAFAEAGRPNRIQASAAGR